MDAVNSRYCLMNLLTLLISTGLSSDIGHTRCQFWHEFRVVPRLYRPVT